MLPDNDVCGKQQTPNVRRRSWLKISLLVIAALTAVTKLDSFIWGMCGYPPWSFYGAVFLSVVIGLLGLVWVVIQLIRKLRTRQTRFWTTATILSVLLIWYYLPIPPHTEMHKLGFYIWARNNVDVESIAAWAETFEVPAGANEFDKAHGIYRVPPSELPEAARGLPGNRLGPYFSFEPQTHTLDVWYGSGMGGHWGIMIGRGAANGAYGYSLGSDAYVWER